MGKSVYSSVNSSKPVSLYFVDDLEETMAKSFVRSANLRALIFKSECPKIIQNCQPIFQRLVDPQLRDTLQTDMQILSSLTEDGDADEYDDNTINWNEQTARPIPKDLSTALARFHCESPRTAQFLLRVKINGLVYSPMSKHQGNACILLRLGDQSLVPAQIQTIFQIPVLNSVQTLLAIRRHRPSQLPHDPFSRFPVLRAQLWHAQLGDLEIISPDKVSSHFACLPMAGDFEAHVVIASLSRVSNLFTVI